MILLNGRSKNGLLKMDGKNAFRLMPEGVFILNNCLQNQALTIHFSRLFQAEDF